MLASLVNKTSKLLFALVFERDDTAVACHCAYWAVDCEKKIMMLVLFYWYLIMMSHDVATIGRRMEVEWI